MSVGRRVLSVQSHVVHGYVGNKCAVFPLQLLGYDVDVINTVQFCNHTGYPHFAGQILDGPEIKKLADGLQTNGLLDYSHLLTGYIGSSSNLEQVAELVRRIRLQDDSLIYLCDPVMGDNGALYAPSMSNLIDIYKNQIIPLCTILTPNQFEAETLTDIKITDTMSAVAACEKIHQKGVETVIITTLELQNDKVNMLLSTVKKNHGSGKFLLTLPKIKTVANFTGTGDLASSLLLAWTSKYPDEMVLALEKTAATLQSVLNCTSQASCRKFENRTVPPELRVIQSKQAIEEPEIVHRAVEIQHNGDSIDRNVRWDGMIFDMDATLTQPGQIDWREMKRRVGVPTGDIVTGILRKESKEEQEECLEIVKQMEIDSFENVKLMPNCVETIRRLKNQGLKIGMITRNQEICVNMFLEEANVKDCFDPDAIITRNSPIENKPSGAGIEFIAKLWNVDPAKLLMIGDSIDDIKCGRAAGSQTCLIGPATDEDRLFADYIITDLSALERFI